MLQTASIAAAISDLRLYGWSEANFWQTLGVVQHQI